MSELVFTKMHGLGNDYIFLFNPGALPCSFPTLSRKLSRRHVSVGSDGMIVIVPSDAADWAMRIFNADGSEAEMCGNGLRCVAKYLFDRNLVHSPEMTINTLAGNVTARIIETKPGVSQVSVVLPEPRFEPDLVPIAVDRPFVEEALDIPGLPTFRGTALSVGNPHLAIFVEGKSEEFPVGRYGPILETDPLFPARTNVEFIFASSRDNIRVRVWERGSGETQACGSGASAAVVAGVVTGRLGNSCTVRLNGGNLRVEWLKGSGITLIGPAEEVFRGTVPFEYLQEGS